MRLANKHCVPCEGGVPPFTNEKEEEFIKKVPNWLLIHDGTHGIRRQFTFRNFREAIDFTNKVADIAEKEGHHPDIYIFYNKVSLDLFTHAVGGLSDNDFIVAAKINQILKLPTEIKN